jgi:signal transduction histidine kinase
MAHELRQPLSTIESIAYYLTLVLPEDDGKVHEQLQRIQDLVEQSNWIVTSAQQLAEPMNAEQVQAEQRPVRLDDLVRESISARSAIDEGPAVEMDDDLPSVQADPGLTRGLVDNLLSLFRAISTPRCPAKLALRRDGEGVAMELATEAQGYKSEASLGPGATLSLDSARRVCDAQKALLDLAIDPADGVRVRVMLP